MPEKWNIRCPKYCKLSRRDTWVCAVPVDNDCNHYIIVDEDTGDKLDELTATITEVMDYLDTNY